MRYTIFLACTALASSVLAHPGSSDYGLSEANSHKDSSSISSEEVSYYGDKLEYSGNSWSGKSSPSYQGEESNYLYESKSFSKADNSHETKTRASDYRKETKTHDSYSKETEASKTYSHVWKTHHSKSYASYSKETHSAKYHKNSTTTECRTHTRTYTRTETGTDGGYTTIINISFTTETMGVMTSIPILTTTPLAITSTSVPLSTLTTTSAAIATSTPLQQANGTSTAPITFTGAAARSFGTRVNGLAAAGLTLIVILCL